MAEYIWLNMQVAIASILNWGEFAEAVAPTGDVMLINATDQALINATDLVQI